MRMNGQASDVDGFAKLDSSQTRVLSAVEERELLRGLAECKAKLAEALAKVNEASPPTESDDPQTLAQYIAEFYAGDGPTEARLGAVFRRYSELRGKLALANLRLVAHVAKRFRERGIAYADLLQEGFCGLLEAIDRFDLNHETKLATYATWWIRQAMQRAVASGAYPVRLSPRHLRQLAQNQDELDRTGDGHDASASEPSSSSSEMIHRIHTATRPTVSLDAIFDGGSNFTLLQTMSDPDGDRTEEIDMDETVARLFQSLRPREQEVLSLRFGLGGKPRLSLSQVGKVLEVSKERVRQIQDRALEKLREAADQQKIEDLLLVGN
ncbi:MAG: sigma-70 family RNA polymerase sigma factor [Isosphaeraceae bacterium]